jgi:hypothetical protein
MDRQLEMFAAPTRPDRREASRFHAAVIFLRKKGQPVYRVSGKQSAISGRIVDNRTLVKMAGMLGWSKE